DGTVYLSDDAVDSTPKIWHVSGTDDYEIVLGEGAPGKAGEVVLLRPQGVAVDPQSGTVYVVDAGTGTIYRLPVGGEPEELISDETTATIQYYLKWPDGIALGAQGELFIADDTQILRLRGNTLEVFAGLPR